MDSKRKPTPTSTVGRGKSIVRIEAPETQSWRDSLSQVYHADSLDCYQSWPTPQCIVSDGAYGVLGFEGDTSDHTGMPEWYEPHIRARSSAATAESTLSFWNSEIGWAAVHPVLERHGWRYVNANIWNKGIGHIAGNVNTSKIRRFPVVTEVCVQYVREASIAGAPLKEWLYSEWKRTGLPFREANKACGVADAATRKYLDRGHLWYWMPPEMFERLSCYANTFGDPSGRPYFTADGQHALSMAEWAATRSRFNCPHGFTNVWERPAVRGAERIKTNGTTGKAVHLNQKPLDLMTLIIEASTDVNGVMWEPFGGLFSASVAARRLRRRTCAAEIDGTYFHYGLDRLKQEADQHSLF